MNKYSDEFKIKAVQMVLDGNAVKYVCRILAIPDSRPLPDWLAHYNHGGFNQLLHKNRSYSPDFKQKFLEHCWQHGLSLKETAALFAIPNNSTIHQWKNSTLPMANQGCCGAPPPQRPGISVHLASILQPNTSIRHYSVNVKERKSV